MRCSFMTFSCAPTSTTWPLERRLCAKVCPVFLHLTRVTLPKLPFPSAPRNSSSSKLYLTMPLLGALGSLTPLAAMTSAKMLLSKARTVAAGLTTLTVAALGSSLSNARSPNTWTFSDLGWATMRHTSLPSTSTATSPSRRMKSVRPASPCRMMDSPQAKAVSTKALATRSLSGASFSRGICSTTLANSSTFAFSGACRMARRSCRRKAQSAAFEEAVTVAARGARKMSANSPKDVPGPNSPTFSPSLKTSSCPRCTT
mmetsp:Transcript_13141/g.37817  ORF Transcript_13141/g.37817 Transcript_13141/m.37817 type:complete len:258 (-) Transcript_13141:1129-1902(-)